MTATAADRHRALAACSPAALKVWHAVVALTTDHEPCTLARIETLTGLHPRTITKARAELRWRNLLPEPEESTSRARVFEALQGINVTAGTPFEIIDRMLVALGEVPTNGADRAHLRTTIERFGGQATISAVEDALGVPGLGNDRWRYVRQVAAKEYRNGRDPD